MASGIDFAALRREREARENSRKRERSISPPATRKEPIISTSTTTLPSGARLSSFTSTVQADQLSRKSAVANAANESLKSKTITSSSSPAISSSSDLQYPNGAIKKTWAFGHDRDGHDVKIEEVLEARTLRTAVLSAFQWSTEWVFSKLKTPLNGGTTKCVFIMQAKEADLRQQITQQTAHTREWLRMCFPPMEGQTNCMHSKLMLLFHPHKLRIAIPSANLLEFDWGESGAMENSVFMIDLPRLSEGKTELTDFSKELLFFVDKQGLQQDVKDGILNFDFSATKHIAFVHSIGGIATGPDASHSGLTSLSHAVSQLGQQAEDLQIDFASSSIGSLKDAQLSLLHAAACGANVFESASAAASQKAATFFDKGASRNSTSIRDKIRIYFPTSDTVKSSTAGATGTICLARKWFEDQSFPKRIFRDYVSTRRGLLSHNKIMYVQGTAVDGKKVAWVYHGSANMSESAWGKLVVNKRTKSYHVNCRNWECGVVMAVDTENVSDDGTALTVFDGILPAPFQHPASEYGSREPWYFTEHQ